MIDRTLRLPWTAALCIVLAAALPASRPAAAHDGDACERLQEVAVQFRRYRQQVTESGDRVAPELRAWDGPMHRVMSEAGSLAAACGPTAHAAVRLLGPPDSMHRGGTRHATVVVPRGETHLVYEWRGGHDYLYLVVRDRRVVDARWWYAGE